MSLPICRKDLPPKETLAPLYALAEEIGVEIRVAPLLESEMGRRFYCNGRPCDVHHGGKTYGSKLRLWGEYGTYTRFLTDVPELGVSITWAHNSCSPSLGLFCEYIRYPDRLVGYSYRHSAEERKAEIAERRRFRVTFPDFPWPQPELHSA